MLNETEEDKYINDMVKYYTDKPEHLELLLRKIRSQFVQLERDYLTSKRLLYVIIFLNFIYFSLMKG